MLKNFCATNNVLERFKASHAFTESDVMTYDHYETSNLEVLKQLLFWML